MALVLEAQSFVVTNSEAMQQTLRSLTLAITLVILADPSTAQVECDSVVVDFVQYDAVDPLRIEVSAYLLGSGCISYPSFILYGPSGDTLAIETVDFFCLWSAPPQSHFLDILPDALIPGGPFDARLELFSGFGNVLVCAWDLDALDLCPQDECVEAEIYLTNTGELVSFTAYWWLSDVNGSQVQDGWFEMDTLEHTHFDTLCLAPGSYILSFTPFSPIDESYVIGITPSYQRTVGTNTALVIGSSPLDLPFTWFEACTIGANSIRGQEPAEVQITFGNGELQLIDPDAGPLGHVQLFTSDGRLVRSLSVAAERTTIQVEDLATGIHLVRIVRPGDRPIVQRVFIP